MSWLSSSSNWPQRGLLPCLVSSALAVSGWMLAACHDLEAATAAGSLPCERDSECTDGAACIAGACAPPGQASESPGDEGAGTSGESGPPGESDGATTADRCESPNCTEFPLPPMYPVDVLFVVDAGATTVGEQHWLVEMIDELAGDLEPGLDLRVAFTTTDVGHPRCGDSPAAAGAFEVRPCRARLSSFEQLVPEAEVGLAELCLDPCPYDALELLPTVADPDGTKRVRPWLQRTPREDNVARGRRADTGAWEPVDFGVALQCVAAQGVSGCEFSSPLEALHRAIERAGDPADPAFGFIRPEATFVAILITNKADCSTDPAQAGAFFGASQCEALGLDPADCTRALWADPSAAASTPAVCWNAGTACTPRADGGFDCRAADRTPAGVPTEVQGASVLYPLARYVEPLLTLRARKQALNPAARVIVNVFAGADAGAASYGEPWVYRKGEEPEFELQYGVAPGCWSSRTRWGVPPVRLREFAAAVTGPDGPQALGSVCSDAPLLFFPSFETLAIQPWQRAACSRACVADATPGDGAFEPACTVTKHLPGQAPVEVPPCVPTCDGRPCAASELDRAERWSVPAGLEECVVFQTDRDGLATPAWTDDMDVECSVLGTNVSFLRISARWPIPGTRIWAECAPSAAPEVDCPALP